MANGIRKRANESIDSLLERFEREQRREAKLTKKRKYTKKGKKKSRRLWKANL